LELISR